ncbi:hypothetical protein AAVH_24968 [Aphelenchoides avenae]|nr:hypothetical protein AAVH_24968 [Aphelenchus avenae]
MRVQLAIAALLLLVSAVCAKPLSVAPAAKFDYVVVSVRDNPGFNGDRLIYADDKNAPHPFLSQIGVQNTGRCQRGCDVNVALETVLNTLANAGYVLDSSSSLSAAGPQGTGKVFYTLKKAL